jgi:hypothetical protein
MIRNPRGAYYGGLVAAPAFHLMVKRIVGIAPVSPPEQDQLVSAAVDSGLFSISQLKNLDIRFAKKILVDLGFSQNERPETPVDMPNRSGAGDKIGNIVFQNDKKMPLVTGLTLKEALHLLSRLDINASIEGHGVVIEQYPTAGRKVNEQSAVKLVCHPS